MPKSVRTAIAALALLAAAQAHALMSFDLPLSGSSLVSGSFSEGLGFNMPGANAGLTATLMSSNLGGYSISDFAFSITGPGGFLLADSAPGAPAGSFTILSGLHAGSLAAGTYLLTVTGTATGTSGGAYGFSLAALQALPVPEPGAWALIAAGLVFMAVIARRRARA
jgi:hypothetical protein